MRNQTHLCDQLTAEYDSHGCEKGEEEEKEEEVHTDTGVSDVDGEVEEEDGDDDDDQDPNHQPSSDGETSDAASSSSSAEEEEDDEEEDDDDQEDDETDGDLEMGALAKEAFAAASSRDYAALVRCLQVTRTSPSAVEKGKEEKEFLLDVDECYDAGGATLVHRAAASGDLKLLKLLLRYRTDASVNQANAEGMSPIHLAVRGRHLAIVRALLEHPKCNLEKRVRSTPYEGYSALDFACFVGDYDIAELLVSHTSLAAAVGPRGNTALHVLASHSCNLDILNLLLTKGDANPDQQDKTGYTPLMHACTHVQIQFVRRLLKLTGNHLDLRAQDQFGDTALHHAFKVQHQRIFNFGARVELDNFQLSFFLIQSGAPVEEPANIDEDVPLDLVSAEVGSLLSFLHEHRDRLQDLHSIEQFLSLSPTVLSRKGFTKSEQELFFESCARFRAEIKEVMEEARQTGGCPVMTPANSKVRRRKPVPEKYRAAIPQPGNESQSNATSAAGTGAACPFTGRPASSGAKCPFGFSGETSSTSSSTEAKCPFGFSAASESDADPRDAAPQPTDISGTTPSVQPKFSLLCPYHWFLAGKSAASSPVFWMGTAMFTAGFVAGRYSKQLPSGWPWSWDWDWPSGAGDC